MGRLLLIIALLLSLAPLAPRSTAQAAPTAEIRRETVHFAFLGAEDAGPSIDRLADIADQRFGQLCRQLGACDALDGPIEVWIAEDPERFASAFPDGAPMAEWAAGVTFSGTRRVVLRAHGSALFSLVETFDHEVAHVLIHAAARDQHVPRWLNEGLAIWLSGEDVVGRLDAAHRAAITGNLIPLSELDRSFPNRGSRVALAYAQSALFTRHLMRRHGPHALPALVLEIGAGEPFERAFLRRFGDHPETLARQWAEDLEDQSSALMLLRDGSVFWVLMSVLFVIAARIRFRERRAQMERLDEEDLIEEAAVDLATQREAGEPPTLH